MMITKILLWTVLFAPFPGDEADLGDIHFPTSANGEAQAHFHHGALYLHSFEYSDARAAFEKARELDPDFAMATWGVAMTYNQPIWNRQQPDQARAALKVLAPNAEARAAKAPSIREKDYLATLEVLFGEGDKPSRDLAYCESMRRLSPRS